LAGTRLWPSVRSGNFSPAFPPASARIQLARADWRISFSLGHPALTGGVRAAGAKNFSPAFPPAPARIQLARGLALQI
jgi:hypothetical protein